MTYADEPRMAYPLSKKSIDVHGVATRYLERGQGDAVMVLLHNGLFSKDGFCADSLAWEHNLERLGRQFRVLAPDMLGQGETELPRHRDDYSYAGMVAHVRGFLNALGVRRVHLVGHDQGATVALHIALDAPECVASCTVVDSPTVAPSGDGLPNSTIAGALHPLYSRDSQAWVLARQSFTAHHVTSGHLLEAAAAHAKSEKFARLREQLAAEGMELQLLRSATRAKVDAFVRLREHGVRVPVLLLWGADDPMSSANHVVQLGASPESNSAIAHARAVFNLVRTRQPLTRLSIMARAGYMPFREQPEAFDAIVGGFAQAVDSRNGKERAA